MFSIPQSHLNSEETMEGCPIIRLDDSLEDVVNFLKVLLSGPSYVYPLYPGAC